MTRAIAKQMEAGLTRRTIQPRTLATDPNYDKPISNENNLHGANAEPNGKWKT